ncbi:uncharacterized protein [Venturia canescens]|uniref:uncharacterized protein n=1 Tax=Venturia canescens TaxID=32260 RepID=UPI001C9C4F8D|nr:uncharacterized protein LOC122416804 [Venturia canescens]
MDNNISMNRVHTTPGFSLVIKNFDDSDTGIYRCHGPNGEEEENKYNYRLEAVHKPNEDVEVSRGNITDWEKYREVYLQPVTDRFAVSRINEFVEIREAGVVLELVSVWTPWGPCERCVNKKGIKSSRGQCRVKRRFTIRVKFFHICLLKKQIKLRYHRGGGGGMHHTKMKRSEFLAVQFPLVSKATRDLPEFILEEKCKDCVRVKVTKRNDFKYKKRYTLAQGAHLTIVCPDATHETMVVWRKDSLVLKKGMGRSFRRKDAEPRVLVDTFSTLYLIDVSIDEEGNYTCYADNVKMLQVQIRVFSKSRLLTQAFLRHVGYLGFIFLLTSFCYCGGLIIVCREKDKFKIKNIEDVEND